MPTAETYTEFVRRYRAMEALWQVWNATSPDVRDALLPPALEPYATWIAGEPWVSEDEAVAAGMAAVWP